MQFLQLASFLGFTVSAAGCAGVVIYPLVERFWSRLAVRIEMYQDVKVEKAVRVLDDLFVDVKPRWLKIAYGIGPVVAGLAVFIVTNNPWLALLGMVAGLIIPDLWVRQRKAMRRRKFQGQLVDALFILSSSLRAGLSMTQAFEQLESEMGPPASQEFGLMMKAHRLGLTLEESLQRLNERMPCDELNLITTAVLVARETGGDITGIISQLITTIRERKKLNDKVKSLTLQGRIQAYVMSMLPIFFAMFVQTFNRDYFRVLMEDETGNLLLMAAVALWVVGMLLLIRMSKVEI